MSSCLSWCLRQENVQLFVDSRGLVGVKTLDRQ